MKENLEPFEEFEKAEKKVDIKQAVMIIGEIRQQVGIMGANDYEIPALDSILNALNEGECTPEEAVKQAHIIRDRKSDYH
jgi:hypothetical protein